MQDLSNAASIAEIDVDTVENGLQGKYPIESSSCSGLSDGQVPEVLIVEGDSKKYTRLSVADFKKRYPQYARFNLGQTPRPPREDPLRTHYY